jgi:hypothetical protein
MEKKDDATAIRLINQALTAATSSINLAKQLLSELTLVKSPLGSQPPATPGPNTPEVSAIQLPGVIGTFDGQFMNTDDGQKFQIPENYASKSMIVFGDKLKMVDVNGEKRFKQIERTKRQRSNGMIVKKEGRYHVVTSDGSYKVSSAAVSFFGGKEGDEAHIILPLNNKHVPFAALESVGAKQTTEIQAIPTLPIDTHIEKNEPEKSSREKQKENREEKSEKDPEPAKKVAKSSKNKEKTSVEKPDEEAKSTRVSGIGKEVEKSNTPLIGDDELR